ncbi:hypothetical protein RB594_006429 [Gaeumannomyces avenae]
MPGLRITSWNVNGIRNPFAYQPWRENKTYQAMFDSLEADIVIMQETKIQRKDLQDDMVLVPGWDVYFSLPKFKKGYSGVAIYTRSSKCCPIRAEEGITGVLCPPNSATRFRDLPADCQIGGYPRPGQLTGDVDETTLDSEGRCMILEFPAFVLIGVYSPATRDETRRDFRLGFQEAMDVRVRNLVAMGKHVVLTGDLNIIRGELDTAGLVDRLRKENMSLDDFLSTPSRRLLNHLVFGGVVIGKRDDGRETPVMCDLGREFHPVRQGMYTCWETRRNARPSNFGSRIDYVLCSAGIRSWFVDAGIQEGLLGSDHCPVYATLSDIVKSIKDMFSKRAPRSSHKETPPVLSTAIASKPQPNPPQPYDPGQVPYQNAGLVTHTSMDTQAAASTAFQSGLQKRPRSARVSPPQKKKVKSAAGRSSGKQSTSGSQTSLRGFFTPKQPLAPPLDDGSLATAQTPAPPEDRKSTTNPSLRLHALESSRQNGEVVRPDHAISEMDDSAQLQQIGTFRASENIFDPIQSKESWSKILGKRVAPNCEHGEPCTSLVTKKPGVNCGEFLLGPRGMAHNKVFRTSQIHPRPAVLRSICHRRLWTKIHAVRSIILHVRPAARTIRGERKGHRVEVRHIHLEQRLGKIDMNTLMGACRVFQDTLRHSS